MANTKLVKTGTIVPSTDIKQMCSQMEFWGELTQDEQKAVLVETQGLYDDLAGMKQLRMSAARHVLKLHSLLVGEEGKRSYFVRFMQSLDQSVRSSYRWMNILVDLNLPEPVLDAAEKRGVDLIQASYVQAIRQLPAPKTVDPDTYLDKVLKERARMAQDGLEGAGRSLDPSVAEREAWRAVVGRYKRVAPRARRDWGVRLIGRLMAALGLPAQRFEPEAVPDDFTPKRGRRAKAQ